ncbi:feruloyl esterase [Variovorax sp. HW608]|uniref:tannase/feruloyl esterase family alpha/beta hydrolase n=1 Tax=Variovorax sp. HW608 TaxID=1034889 RepID=UPI00081F7C39|nr:tannase/feruloyl esterase family alpha/beta hydrolase [Variovorax sp. HW608]SCK11097.1 feruloyl esterase [Variovorax sp. HW608]
MNSRRSRQRWDVRVLFGLIVSAGVAGCGGGGSGSAAVVGGRSCAEMAGLTVSASDIGLATQGAKVTGATSIAASGTGSTAVGAFCRVTAEIAPVDTTASPIKMEVNLPETWNGKALMFGGGGLNGSILSTAGTIRLQPANVAIPLGRGYVTFGSDSGHSGTTSDGTFARNDEMLRNYAYEALKKTKDVATKLVSVRYGKAPDKLYFHGSSNGGKEAMAMIQRYPNDIDAAMIFWPATMFGTAQVQWARISKAFAQPGAYLSMAKRKLVLDAAMSVCDGLDGVTDGLISNPKACQTSFDPSTANYAGKPVRCASGTDEGDSCLSDAQIMALKTMATPMTFSYPLGSGETQFPGYSVWGMDLGAKTSDSVSSTVTQQGLGSIAPTYPAAANMPYLHIITEQYIKYFVARDSNASWATVDPANPVPYVDRISQLTALLDQPKTDLSEFYMRGGKIILLHGNSDQLIPYEASEDYYRRVVAKMGSGVVNSFMKFYELPGTAHSGVGTSFTPTWDVLGALDTWVSTGQAPVAPVITDTYAVPGRTRPLCEYPQYPRYQSGNVNSATSFTCVN